jgi:hypothetical protein
MLRRAGDVFPLISEDKMHCELEVASVARLDVSLVLRSRLGAERKLYGLLWSPELFPKKLNQHFAFSEERALSTFLL